jgi:hypothetical protein
VFGAELTWVFGLSGCWTENWASVVPWSTNSTDTSAIYKLTSGPADYLNFWIAGSGAAVLKIGLLLLPE